jgi:hypothetical protein
VGLVAALAALVAAAFGTFFTGGLAGPATVALLGTAVGGAALGGLAGARLRPGWLVALAGLVGALVSSLLVVFAGRPGDGHAVLSAYGAAVRDGWANMLTVGLPARPEAGLLVLPVLVL